MILFVSVNIQYFKNERKFKINGSTFLHIGEKIVCSIESHIYSEKDCLSGMFDKTNVLASYFLVAGFFISYVWQIICGFYFGLNEECPMSSPNWFHPWTISNMLVIDGTMACGILALGLIGICIMIHDDNNTNLDLDDDSNDTNQVRQRTTLTRKIIDIWTVLMYITLLYNIIWIGVGLCMLIKGINLQVCQRTLVISYMIAVLIVKMFSLLMVLPYIVIVCCSC